MDVDMNVVKGEIFYADYCPDFPCKVDSKSTYVHFTDVRGNKVNISVSTVVALYEKIRESVDNSA